MFIQQKVQVLFTLFTSLHALLNTSLSNQSFLLVNEEADIYATDAVYTLFTKATLLKYVAENNTTYAKWIRSFATSMIEGYSPTTFHTLSFHGELMFSTVTIDGTGVSPVSVSTQPSIFDESILTKTTETHSSDSTSAIKIRPSHSILTMSYQSIVSTRILTVNTILNVRSTPIVKIKSKKTKQIYPTVHSPNLSSSTVSVSSLISLTALSISTVYIKATKLELHNSSMIKDPMKTAVIIPSVLLNSAVKITIRTFENTSKDVATDSSPSLNPSLLTISESMTTQASATLSSGILKSFTSAEMSTKKTTTAVEAKYYCDQEWLRDRKKGDYFFRKSYVFDTIELPCKYGFINRLVSRRCLYDKTLRKGKWEDADLTFCLTKSKLKGLMKKIDEMEIKNETAEESSSYLALTIVNNIDIVQTHFHIQIIFSTITKLLQLRNTNKKVYQNVVKVLGSFALLPDNLVHGKYVQEIETILMNLFDCNKNIKTPFSINSENIAISISKSNKSSIKISIISGREHRLQQNIEFNRNISTPSNDSIFLPASLFKNIPEGTNILAYTLQNLPIYPTKNEEKIISRIIAITIMHANRKHENLIHPIEIEFTLLTNEFSGGVASCRYWESAEENWSTKGCSIEKKSANRVLCKCNHMTTFAVIVEPNNKDAEMREEILSHIIQFVAMAIAICTLGITFITYLCVKELRRVIYSRAIIYFSASLIMTIIAFVGATTFISKPPACYVFGKLLHYFILTTFAWMLVQALNLYRAIVVITVQRADTLKWISVFVWGVPLVIVGVTVYFTIDQVHSDSLAGICFAEGIIFYATFLAPACLLIVISFLIFLPIFKNIIRNEDLNKDTVEYRNYENSKRTKMTVLIDLSCTILWASAVLAYALQVDILIYVFHALTLLFGMLVCVVFVLLNDKAKEGWTDLIRCWCCCTYDNKRDEEEMVYLKKHSKSLMDEHDSKSKNALLNMELYGDSTPKSFRPKAKEDLV